MADHPEVATGTGKPPSWCTPESDALQGCRHLSTNDLAAVREVH
uniref:Uncharacterized protein n=1 Tax=Arundo donax TaxID=35708 RepID=A0A0A8ZKJ8_ARUDO